jgi:hypothetical protein
MPVPDAIPVHAIDRFLAILPVLQKEHSWQGAWLRFAAQAAVSTPGDPRDVADAILHMAERLRTDASWLDAMHSPLRYLVAAMLVQAGDSAADFEAELARARQIFRLVGISHGGIHEIMAILLLRRTADGNPIALEQIERLHAIYLQLKRRHWWLTSPRDLPTCAVLVGLQGTPDEVGRHVEEHYRLLSEDGFSAGVQLQQAAHILPLLRLPAQQAVRRYGALARRFAEHGSPPWQQDYEAIAILSLLDQDAEMITALCLDIYKRLTGIRPLLHHEVLIDLAANLTFIDLIHQADRSLGSADDGSRRSLRRMARDGLNTAAVLACLGGSSIDPASS